MQPHEALGPLARQDGEAIFNEAWQAQALAMADCLVQAGVFSATEWAEALGAAIQENPDTTDGYYSAVLNALERLLNQGPLPSEEIGARRDAWARAYEATPHGQPVELETIE